MALILLFLCPMLFFLPEQVFGAAVKFFQYSQRLLVAGEKQTKQPDGDRKCYDFFWRYRQLKEGDICSCHRYHPMDMQMMPQPEQHIRPSIGDNEI